ncbi:MAG: hypothetical protein MJ246_08540 [Clostridia bacterium]|nr:hypothetical protein [Clostridia bacterium]
MTREKKKFKDTIWCAIAIVLVLCFISLGIPLILTWVLSSNQLLLAFALGVLGTITLDRLNKRI